MAASLAPPETSTVSLVFGFLEYALSLVPTLGAMVFVISAFTISPTVLSAAGISGGGSIFKSSTFIRGEEVDRVDCTSGPQHSIMDVTVRAESRGVVIIDTATYYLGDVRSMIESRVPEGAVHPCRAFRVPSSRLPNR